MHRDYARQAVLYLAHPTRPRAARSTCSARSEVPAARHVRDPLTSVARRRDGQERPTPWEARVPPLLATVGLSLGAVFGGTMSLTVALGPAVPADSPLSFAATAVFVALLLAGRQRP